MKWVIIVLRTLLGAQFVFASTDYFFKYANAAPPPPPGHAEQFMTAMIQSGYFDAIKAVELVGGLLLLTGFFANLGIICLGPVIVNICLYNVFMTPLQGAQLGMTIVLPAVLIFLIFAYRDDFSRIFHPWPTPRW